MTTPLLLGEALGSLGLGQQVTVAATVGIFVLYLFRGRKAAGAAVGIFGKLWFAAVSVGIGIVLVILLGWANPNPDAFASDVGAALAAVFDAVGGFVIDRLESFIDSVLPEFL